MRGRFLLVAILAAVVAAQALPAPAAPAADRRHSRCTDRTKRVHSTAPKLGLEGLYALPRAPRHGPPRDLVVFAHGYRKPATAYWRGNLRATAARGAVAVAMDYRGIGPAPDYRGWNVRTGARDSIRAARYFLRHCPSLRQVTLMGISMGGNVSGFALAKGATGPGGKPLFDYWIDVEGATNVTETYLEARAAAPSGEYIAGARDDIEAEMGGTIEEVPGRYRQATVVTRADDIAASDVKGVVFVHGLEDGLVPYDQSREMAAALREEGVPYDFFTVLTRGDGDDGTTLSGHALGSTGAWTSPFAGHGGEEDRAHLVIGTAFDRLWRLIARNPGPDDRVPGPAREFVTDGIAGTNEITPG